MFGGESNGTPLQYSCLENAMDRGAWWAAVHGVPKSRARLSDFPFPLHFHALEKEMATHSSVLAWRTPGTGEPGGLPSMGSHRIGPLTSWPLPWAGLLMLAPGRPRMKRLSSSSSMCVWIPGDGVVLNHGCNLGLPLNHPTLSNSLQCSEASASLFYRIMAWEKLCCCCCCCC